MIISGASGTFFLHLYICNIINNLSYTFARKSLFILLKYISYFSRIYKCFKSVPLAPLERGGADV